MGHDPVAPDAPTATEIAFVRVTPDGTGERIARAIAQEVPIAIEINGLGYAVLMATPADLEDLAAGFLLAERLIDGIADVVEIAPLPVSAGVLLRVTVAARVAGRIADRVRHRVSDSACGLCGIENLEQALRPLPPAAQDGRVDAAAVFRALRDIEPLQTLNRRTGAAHGAALCAADGSVRAVREDVGRHNAFDKLVGAMLRGGLAWGGGFALLTSRCSYELVEKAVLSGCPMLVTISAATGLAIARAREAGLALRTLARRDAFLES